MSIEDEQLKQKLLKEELMKKGYTDRFEEEPVKTEETSGSLPDTPPDNTVDFDIGNPEELGKEKPFVWDGDLNKSVKDETADETIARYKYLKENQSETGKQLGEISEAYGKWHSERKLNWNPANWAYMSLYGALDVPFDVLGQFPGFDKVNESWDRGSKFDHEGANNFRALASFVIPTIATQGAYAKAAGAMKLQGLTKAAGAVGVQMATTWMTDYGENPDNRFLLHPDRFKWAAEKFPQAFGPDGFFPSIGELQHADEYHPYLNKLLGSIDEGAIDGAFHLIGYGLNGGRKLFFGQNLKPKNNAARIEMSKQQIKHLEIDTAERIVDIDDAIKSGGLNEVQKEALQQEKSRLLKQATETGSSEATKSVGDSYLRTRQNAKRNYFNSQALKNIAKDPQISAFDPAITPKLASEKALLYKYRPPGAYWRNIFDVDEQLVGGLHKLGVPTSPLSKSMEKNGLILGKSRHMFSKVFDKASKSADYEYVRGMFRSTTKEASQHVYDVYNKIMVGSGDELRQLLKDKYYREPTSLFDAIGKKVEVTYIDDATADAAALAMHDLVNLYIGREMTESSARIMHTLGAELSSKSGAALEFGELMDQPKMYENIMDKLELLSVEYGINKYVRGFQLNRKKWWHRLLADENPGHIAMATLDEFNSKAAQISADYKAFRARLDDAAKRHPALRRALLEAYDHTDGAVDTIDLLTRYVRYQTSPIGALFGRKIDDLNISPWEMNQFAKGMWAVTYNSVLSGLSAARAAIGNGFQLLYKPMATFTRAGIRSVLTADTEPLERAIYMHSAMFETASRAWGDALVKMRKVHRDPDFLLQAARKDFIIEDNNTWSILDNYAEAWENTDDLARNFTYGWASFQRKISKSPWLRTGMTGMVGVDAFTDTFMATYYSRLRAYDDVFTKYGKTLDSKAFEKHLLEAEKANYSKMFDRNGILTDAAAKNASGEVALNLEEGVSKWLNPALNRYPPLRFLMMFPRTAMNGLKVSFSYTPIAQITGLGKYGKILHAGDDIKKIKAALREHGIKDFENTPNYMAIYKNLKDEYQARRMMGAGATYLSYNYAMAGNIRGNGPADYQELKKLREQNWVPNTIKIGNKWIPYKGIPVVEHIFALVGDMAYYHNALGDNLREETLNKAAWTITATYLNNTPLQGMEPIHAAMRGDAGAFQRLAASALTSAIPLSGAHGVIANQISNAQKEIYKDFWGYVRNRTIFKDMSYSKIDHWTGDEVNEIDNPILRALNGISPIKVHGGNEDWRVWLLNSGFNDLASIETSSKGIKYDAQQREAIGKMIGEQQLWKVIQKDFMNNKYFNADLDKLRAYVRSPEGKTKTAKEIREFANSLPVYQELDKLLQQAKRNAERKLMSHKHYKHLDILGDGKLRVKKLMELGRFDEAKEQAKRNEEFRKLTEYGFKKEKVQSNTFLPNVK